MRKRLLTAIFIAITIIITLQAAPVTKPQSEQVALKTFFTHSKGCFAGLSKKNVIDMSPVTDADKHPSSSAIVCSFIPENNTYESDLFYVYCQSYSSSPITVTIKAPLTFTNTKPNHNPVVDGPKEIPYKFITETGGDDNDWVENDLWKVLTSNNDIHTDKPRVIISHPIKISIASESVRYGQSYSLELTMEVSEP